MENKNLIIRKAVEKDINLIYELIKGLAIYEKRPHDMTATIDMLKESFFNKKVATVLILENDINTPIGYALYYPTFSSFSSKTKIYLEDLYIKPEYRNKGYGKKFFFSILDILKEEGYSTLEWSCLDWNKPSIEFYKNINATLETGRVHFEYKIH